ncbi:putative DEAD-like superfamily protein [Candidatus Accumulibacter aalborgensis]|uniref:Putative DEAD-like superfamily protein n=1 Tax=Candidatus Accumulibacter aalborgensis TaxID=1860102 RepID=A0A1A8XNP0_9PROT|nr:DEAD/DEAH box helicase family protein [Candidatus Accumulibacter aalborgensis]SBT06784.1 putative DEAD-like superfamily protein [Candidatus Accumulibacter aalborgensis]
MTADALVSQHSSAAAKIALFRSLFRGRDDVYPRRFESRRTGKSGYSPACANEWVRGLCAKPAVRCSDCPNRRFLVLTDETIRQHLAGQDETGSDFVIGVYPMLLDETCFFLAVDFDKQSWHDDVKAVRETCRQMGLPAAVERSRSGNGGHLWLFFAEALPAILARKLGAHMLTETMDRRPDIGLDSYDRFFPNQNTLPRGGFGNLIALPLQKRARERDASVFIDDGLLAFPDQWAFLSAMQKIGRAEVERIVCAAELRGRIVGVRFPLLGEDEGAEEPWAVPPSRRRVESPIVGPLPQRLELIVANEIYLAREALPAALRNRLLRLAAFQNPEFYQAQAMRLPTFGKPRIISCAEDHPLHIGLPRGCLDEILGLLTGLGIECVLRDERHTGAPLNVSFHGTLRPEQQVAIDALVKHDQGVLAATTAFGKTVVAAWLIARRGVSTLVLVHRQQLMEQWVERLSTFLELPASAIGRIGGGRKKPNGTLDVALIQSLVRRGVVDDRVGEYGHLVVDECHHLPAASFAELARRAKARYVLGLSATVTRKDGHQPIIFMQCGPVRHRVSARQQAAERPFTHSVWVRPTAFRQTAAADPDLRLQFHDLYQELIADESRNRRIADDVIEAVRQGRSPVVLTERTDHLEKLAQRLSPLARHLVVLRGGMGRRPLKEALAQLASIPESEERVVLATGSYLGEGFDDARLDTLFLTLPVSWRGTIAQYAGRLHRLHDGKRDVRIYDYADLNAPMLARMFDRRCAGYQAMGYTILLPASALPGWPPEVPLPVEPEWKRDYAASVQRLLRDGVDLPLGQLFFHATGAPEAGAQGADRARSASEAFLYRRLETLPATAGKFQLNAELPIPFDGRGGMEVDLLSVHARVAVELDGGQHLTDPAAYRRDRRKDALLQENGYFVLRFLAEDVGKHLDEILDTLLRTLAHRQREMLGEADRAGKAIVP